MRDTKTPGLELRITANIEPDGKTQHFLNRNPTNGWDYVPYNGDVLVDCLSTSAIVVDTIISSKTIRECLFRPFDTCAF